MKALLNFLLLFLALVCNAQEKNAVHSNLSLPKVIDSLCIGKNKIYILIDKSDYALYVRANDIILKKYPVVFGGNAIDDKIMEGDNCTPEGKFSMISKYPHTAWSRFIWINYPNDDSWRKHNIAKKEGRIPGNATIGGEVGIHGVPVGMDYLIDNRENWTLGCISLKNKDIEELYPYITKNTIIEIRK